MDADGDMDLVVGHYYDRIWYFENTAGAGSFPVLAQYVTLVSNLFADNEPGGDELIAPTVVDWDGDGDFDLVVGCDDSGVRVFWNSGDPTSPAFSNANYQQLIPPTNNAYFSPNAVDWDSDGDWDLLVGRYDGFVYFYENVGGTLLSQGTLSTTSGALDIGSYSQPLAVDWDNDGSYDLIVGDYAGYVWAFLHGPPVPIVAEGTVSGGSLNLVWGTCVGANAYWIYGADNQAYFEPGFMLPFQYRVAVLPAATTSWSSPSGVGDPDHNWTYQVIAVDASSQPLSRSNCVGEFDFDTGN
jgi:hypothetical protein